MSMNILIYDCEIANPIDDGKIQRLPDLVYADGWGDYKGMGISVVGCYSYSDNGGSYISFTKDNLKELQDAFDRHALLVGFNNVYFDNKLLEAHGFKIPREKVYDMFLEIKRAANAGKYAKGYNLGNVAVKNGLQGKSGSGENAPLMWQRGLHSEVIEYCLQDVKVTKEVLDLVISGSLLCPVTGQPLDVYKPVVKRGE